MSYILEALKKAQAERQLGSAPTLTAVPVGAAPADAAAVRRRPAWIVLSVVVLAAVCAVAAWRFQASPARTAPEQIQMPTAPPLAVVASSTPPLAMVPTSTSTPALAAAPPSTPPLAVVPRSTPPLAVVPPSMPPLAVVPASTPPVPKPATPKPVAARPAPVPAAAPEEEKLPSLRELPEPIQRSVPQLAFGGYMYSKNPSDRLLLIDKALRHEGEEVAPGLVLEKLLPRAAVMNYKGYRYRVPY